MNIHDYQPTADDWEWFQKASGLSQLKPYISVEMYALLERELGFEPQRRGIDYSIDCEF